MALAHYSFTALLKEDSLANENIASQTALTVNVFRGGVASIYSDINGASAIAQPGAVTDSWGVFEFYAESGYYTIVVGSRSTNVTLIAPIYTIASTTEALIAGLNSTIDIANTTGYTTDGDGGSATWKRNGVTGQTVSQSPAQLADGLLNDASGNQWVLVENGRLLLLQIGGLEDGVTDDYLSILAGLNFLTSTRGVYRGGTLWVTGHALTGTVIVLPKGIYIQGVNKPISLADQVGAPSYPITINEASEIVGSHTAGPVIWQKNHSCGVVDLTISATETRQQAAITSGAGNTNCGLLTETDDTSSAILLYPIATNIVIRNQPADGHYTNGDVVGYKYDTVSAINCGRHGHAADDGQLSARVNKHRPGIGVLINPRAVNTGGHGLAWGHPDSGSNVPFRVSIINYEGIRHGNTPSLLYESAGVYIVAEQVAVDASASAATSGTSGDTATLDHAWAVGGRQIIMNACRYIRCVEEHLLLVSHTGLSNNYISINGGHGSTSVAAPTYFIKVDGSTNKLTVRGLSGNYGSAVDISTITGVADIEDDGERSFHNTVLRDVQANNTYTMEVTLDDDEATSIDFSAGFSSENARGIVLISGSAVNRYAAQIHFRVGTFVFCEEMSSQGTVGVGTTALTGTTGADVSLNIAAVSDGKLYLENRTGASTAYTIAFLCLDSGDGLPIIP